MKKKTICCITGTRADYPRIKSVLREIKNRNSFNLKIIVTGSHLLASHNYSYKEIERDGFNIDSTVEMYDGDYDTPFGMTVCVARCMKGIAEELSKIKPDLALITVDRVETLAAASAAALMNIPIAHVQGGEVTGTIDESIRHAVTKLSHIHFPATKDAHDRILFMGEPSENIFLSGCPYVDIIENHKACTKDFLSKKYNLKFSGKPIAIFTQHPVTTEYGKSKDQIEVTVKALSKYRDKLDIINFNSNPDAGGKEIFQLLEKQDYINLPNMDSEDFLSLMHHADFMIGNSSAGIREAPSFSLPAINIGTRQNGRLRGKNVIDVDHNIENIVEKINYVLTCEDFKDSLKLLSNPYGDGNAAKVIVDSLELKIPNEDLIKKVFVDNHEKI